MAVCPVAGCDAEPVPRWLVDPIVLGLVLTGVLLGSIVGARGDSEDVDERLFRSTLVHMQEGAGFYDAHEQAIIEKSGVGPSQVRSLRTPVLAMVLVWFPDSAWRWLAALPAAALCLAAAALAGPDIIASRIAAGLAALWMVVSLPLLYLHQELWGAPLLAFGALQLRRGHDGPAALLCLLATGIRELFGLSLVVGLLLRRRRGPWAMALAASAAGAALHARWASHVVDPSGYDPPLRALDSYFEYVSPGGAGVAAQVAGVVLLALAGLGFWLRRTEPDQQLLIAVVVPLVVATALSGRSYWALTWCGVTSAAGAVALRRLLPSIDEQQPEWTSPLGPGAVEPSDARRSTLDP